MNENQNLFSEYGGTPQDEKIIDNFVAKQDIASLSMLLGDKRQSIRFYAVKGLGKIRDPRVVESLKTALKDEDFTVFNSAVDGLRGFLNEQALISLTIERYIDVLNGDNDNYIKNAIHQIGNIRDPQIVESLIKVLKNSPHADTRVLATQALEKQHDARAIDTLIAALNDKDGRWNYTGYDPYVEIKVCDAANHALKAITGQDFGLEIAKWEQWWEKEKPNFSKPSIPSIQPVITSSTKSPVSTAIPNVGQPPIQDVKRPSGNRPLVVIILILIILFICLVVPLLLRF